MSERERVIDLTCPNTGRSFTVGFNLDRICQEPLFLACPDYPQNPTPPLERGAVTSASFTPTSMEEIRANALCLTGTPDRVYEGNVHAVFSCPRCGLERRQPFEA